MKTSTNADVLLLAAGFGKRLAPLTDSLPKPLVKAQNKALIDWNLELLAEQGFKRVIVNLHYLPEKIKDHVEDGSKWGIEVCYSFEEVILDTGGAIRKIEPLLLHDNLLIINSDTLFGRSFSFVNLLSSHRESPLSPLATLTLRESPQSKSFGQIGIDEVGRIVSFLDAEVPGAQVKDHLMFAGAHVISRELIQRMPQSGEVFSITQDVYRPLVAEGQPFFSVLYDGPWSDCGTLERLEKAEKLDLSL